MAIPAGRRGTLIALGVALALVGYGYAFAGHWSLRYGAYLVAFTLWMVVFVMTVAGWLNAESA